LNSDANNCGDCGHSCLGGGCTNGACRPVAIVTGQAKPWRITANATGIYWTNNVDQGTVMKAGLDGSTPVPIATQQLIPWGIASDANAVYWTTLRGQAGGTSQGVMKATLPSGAPTSLVDQGVWPRDLAVDASSVYFVTYDNTGVRKVPLNGGTQTMLTNDGGPYGLFLDAASARVYIANFDARRIQSVAIAGGSIVFLVEQLPSGPRGIVVWANNVYYGLSDRIQKVGQFGGTATDVATSQAGPDGMAADASGVYWTNATASGTIVRFNASGVVTIATNQGTPTSIGLTASSIYWTNSTTGEIMRLAK
jgi:hypothetical protein